jgi:hypothetical protein
MSLIMKKKDTQRQKKLVKLISENLGTGKKTKTMYEMMLEAGYEESTALQQSTILTRIYDKVVPIVQRLEAERDRILDALTKKNLRWEKYKDLVDSLDKLTKNIQLLSGKPTEIHDDYRQLSDDELRRLSKGAGGARKAGTGA